MVEKYGVGAKFKTNEGYEIEIVEKLEYPMRRVRFENGHEVVTDYSSIRTGNIKNPYHRSICGVGYFGVGEYKASVNRKTTPKYEIWKEENIDILRTQEVYEEKEYSKIDLGYQFNELSARYEVLKKKQIDNSSHNQREKDMLKLEKRFLRDLGEKVIKEKFWKNSCGAHRIFYIFIEDSVLKIREKAIFGSKFQNESLDIRVKDIFYYQESGKIETRERKAGYVRQSKSPGVIESAIVGGLIAGSTGAIVGGMSGLNNANKRSTEYTITEHNDNREIVIFYKDVEGKNSKYELKGLKNYNATWKILSELIPDKSYEAIALQNGDFHLLNK